jgi:hypothetical protein
MVIKTLLRIIGMDVDEIFADFAEQIGKPSLTSQEKQMAITESRTGFYLKSVGSHDTDPFAAQDVKGDC